MRKILALVGLALCSAAFGQSLTINNASFEADVLSPGGFFYSPTQITGWTSTATGGADRGVWNTGAPGKDGENILFLYGNNSAAQQLTATLMANRIYTLDYLMGRAGGNVDGTIELWAGGTVANGVVTGGTLLASQARVGDTSNMNAFQMTYTSPLTGSTIGQALTVRLARSTNGGGTWMSFDHIRLTSTPVPEPATLVALAGMGLLALRRRRK